MKNKKVIHFKNIPSGLGLWPLLTMYMAVDVYNISGVWVGVCYTIIGVLAISYISKFATQEEIDIFKSDEKTDSIKKSFRERIDDAIEANEQSKPKK